MRRSVIKIELEIYSEKKTLPRMLSLPPCCFFSTRNLTFSSQEGIFELPSNPLLKKTPRTIYFDIISDTQKIAKIVQKN